MIDYTAPRRALEMYLDTNYTLTPIKFENVELSEDITGGFVAVNDIGTESNTLEMGGGNTFLAKGILVIQIYTVLGSGTQQGRLIATNLSTLLAGQDLSGLLLEEPVFESFGQVDGADFFQQNLTIPYQFVYGQADGTC